MGILAVSVMTRLFQPEHYGQYVLVLTTIGTLSSTGVAWVTSSAIRFFPACQGHREGSELYTLLFKWILISISLCAALIGVVLWLFRDVVTEVMRSLMLVGMFAFLTTSLYEFFLGLLRARRQAGWFSAFTVWQSVGWLVLGVLLFSILGWGIESMLWGSVLTALIALPFLWKKVARGLVWKPRSLWSDLSVRILKFGAPATLIHLFSVMMSLWDRYFLKFYWGDTTVGIYSASYAVSERTMFFVNSLFVLASTPIGFSIWETEGTEGGRSFTTQLTRYYLLVSIPAAAGLSALADPIIGILISQKYHGGYRIVPIVAFGALFVGVAHRFSMGLVYEKRNDLLMYCYIASGLINLGLNWMLIPKFGYMAAAVATFLSYASMLFLTVFISKRIFIWAFPVRSAVNSVISAAIMAAVVYPIGRGVTSFAAINLPIAIVIGGAVYTWGLFILREFNRDEIKIAKDIWVKLILKIGFGNRSR